MKPGHPFPLPAASCRYEDDAGFTPIGCLAVRVVLGLDTRAHRPRPYGCGVVIAHPRFAWPCPDLTWRLAVNALLRAAS